MNRKLSLTLIGMAALAGSATVAAHSIAPAVAKDQPFFANVHWDDDAHDRVTRGPMPMPSEAALKRVGMVHVVEVERDDGKLEVEGYDKFGREMDVDMDATGRRVLSVDIDDDDHDNRRTMPAR